MKVRVAKKIFPRRTFVGLDLSLTSTGMAFVYSNGDPSVVRSFGAEVKDRITIERQMYHMRRMDVFTSEIPHSELVVCMEDLQVPFNRKSTGQFIERVELAGMVKLFFAERRKVYVLTCAPNTRRKFLELTGKSSQRKVEVVQAVALIDPCVTCKNSDEADALAVAYMARLAFMRSRDPLWSGLSEKQREAVATVRAANIHLMEV